MKRNILVALALLAPISAGADTLNGAPVQLRDDDGQYVGSKINPVTTQLGGGGALGSGATAYSYMAAASTNATSALAAPVAVFSVVACNQAPALRYVRIYNKASAPVPASDTPVWRGSVPSNGGCVTIFSNPTGILLNIGLAFDITGGAADTDTTATTANDVSLNVSYKP